MSASRIDGDVYINGNLTCKGFKAAPLSINNAAIAVAAAIDATKITQQPRVNFHQPNTAATTERRAVYCVYGATANLLAFRAGSIAIAVGAATVTVDLQKNGVSILTAVITLDTANVARVPEAGSFSSTAFVAGDLLEIVVTATAGGGILPTGVFAQIVLSEDPQ